MAKSRSILDIQGTVEGKTFVDSRTYGDHIRAARGTYKQADVNDVFKQESARLLNANVPAKIVKDAIDLYRHHFKGGQLWQNLVSLFRKQLHENGSVDFSKTEPMEVHERYPMSRVLSIGTEVFPDPVQGVLQVKLVCNFRKTTFLDEHRVGIIGIFPDLPQKKADTSIVYVTGKELKVNPGTVTLHLPVPENATDYILCATVESFVNQASDASPATKGMRILKGGRFKV